MFIDFFKRKLNQLGAEMVEYAIVLACIAAVGVAFYSSDGNLAQVLGNTFNKVVAIVDGSGSSSGKNLLGDFNLAQGSHDDLSSNHTNSRDNRLHSDILDIDPNTDYEIIVDTSKLTLRDGESLNVGFFLTDETGTRNENMLDSGWIYFNNIKPSYNGYNVSKEGDIVSIAFKTGENSRKFAMNFSTSKNDNFISTDSEIKSELKNAVSFVKTGP